MWHIHQFGQRNKTSKIVGGEVWKQRKEGLDEILKRLGKQYRGVFIWGATNPLPTMTHKELFWKKDALVV